MGWLLLHDILNLWLRLRGRGVNDLLGLLLGWLLLVDYLGWRGRRRLGVDDLSGWWRRWLCRIDVLGRGRSVDVDDLLLRWWWRWSLLLHVNHFLLGLGSLTMNDVHNLFFGLVLDHYCATTLIKVVVRIDSIERL